MDDIENWDEPGFWVVISPDGSPVLRSFGVTPNGAMNAFQTGRRRPWKDSVKRGYRMVRLLPEGVPEPA